MARLLIVDDEEKIREMIGKYAVHEGYEVTLASNGREALDIFRDNEYDVIIMDVMMPEMDGYETFKKMREIREVHCIFLTVWEKNMTGSMDLTSVPRTMSPSLSL